MQQGDILGHEFMGERTGGGRLPLLCCRLRVRQGMRPLRWSTCAAGVVQAVGPEVKHLRVGDRVVAAFDLACGQCAYCEHKLFTSCDTTNPG